MIDTAIVGSGIGGALFGALNRDKNIVLFEKENNLGGCASTFKRYGHFFNSGATTFVGYEEGHIIKRLFDRANIQPHIQESKIAMRVFQNGNTLDRTTDFDAFLEQINTIFPNKSNRLFWQTIQQLDKQFWEIENIFYAKHSIHNYLLSLDSALVLWRVFGRLLLQSADEFIVSTLGVISKEYRDFLDAQLLITIQTTVSGASLLSMALGLAYPFHKVFYPVGGMGNIIESVCANLNVQRKEEIKYIQRKKNCFILHSDTKEYAAKKIVLNTTIYDSKTLFEDTVVQKYYENYTLSDQSAFVVYLVIDSEKEFLHHYQIIQESPIINCSSNSFFVSFSDKNDEKMSKNGYSVTISTHTKISFWKSLTKEQYLTQKEQTQKAIIESFLHALGEIERSDIKLTFSATSKTFERFIKRSNCGGKSITPKELLGMPTCTTPIDGLYHAGDTVFAGQGWPGIALGVNILDRVIYEKF